jgi:hypothetical protein
MKDYNYRCKLEDCKKIVKSYQCATNLINHMKTHKELYKEYELKKKNADECEISARQQLDHKRKAELKITEHFTIRNTTKLASTHPRQKQFIANLVRCAAQPSQAINFYARPDHPGRPAPFRRLVQHLDSTIHVPSARTLTRNIHASAAECKEKVCELVFFKIIRIVCTDKNRVAWRRCCLCVRRLVGSL